MTTDEALKCILQTNIRTTNLFRDTFTKLFGYKPVDEQQLSLNDWMQLHRAWDETDAYSYAWHVQRELREAGYDVKMDMQSCKLSYHGLIGANWINRSVSMTSDYGRGL